MFQYFPDKFDERPMNLKRATGTEKKAGCVGSRLSFKAPAGGVSQQVALPQRAIPIFSASASRPTAPTTTCLPIT